MKLEHWRTSDTSQRNVGQVACSRTRSAMYTRDTVEQEMKYVVRNKIQNHFIYNNRFISD